MTQFDDSTVRSYRKAVGIGWLLSIAFPLLFGCLGLWAGKDAGWDVQNYHWYNPYAFLSNRFNFDIAAAQHGSYYNPTLDLPLYWAAQTLSAKAVGYLLTCVQGLNFPLLFWLTWTLFSSMTVKNRLIMSTVCAMAGMSGAGALMLAGDGSYDNITSLGIIASLLVIAKKQQTMRLGRPAAAWGWIGLAGFFAGSMAGLKLTAATYALGLCGGLLFLPTRWPRRVSLAFFFGVGVTLGLLLFSGHWMYRLWEFSGNPFFPYFNDLIHSPLLHSDSHKDMTFQPKSMLVRIFFPFFFSFDSYLVAEWYFRDMRILALFLVLPIGAIWGGLRWRRRQSHGEPWGDPVAARYMAAASVLAYMAWLWMFCIYRYLVPLEMIAPLVIAGAIGWMPLSNKARVGLFAAIILTTQSLVSVNFYKRKPWGDKYVEVQVPDIPLREDPMVLMVGRGPLSYVIPFFPPSIPFTRIDSWIVSADETEIGLAKLIRQRVALHKGSFQVLFDRAEPNYKPEKALASYGFTLDEGSCAKVTSNIAPPLDLCQVNLTSPAKTVEGYSSE
jgi:hypothetical protein